MTGECHLTSMSWLKFRAALSATAAVLSGYTAENRRNRAVPLTISSVNAVAAVREAAIPLRGVPADYDSLVAAAAGPTRVLLGESTHGTHEYYRERARITQRLIGERGFNAIAIEADWSPTYRVNLYVRGFGNDRSAEQALKGYKRFPKWMWRNREFRDFVEQLRAHNLTLPRAQRIGIYGADVYDMFDAADAVVEYLVAVDKLGASRARSHYRCFAGYNREEHRYGAAAQARSAVCAEEAAAVLAEVKRLRAPVSAEAIEAHFAATRAAASVSASESYFRTIHSKADAWNLRDQKMAENVDAIATHAERLTGREGRVAVWSHNSHTGDARATIAAHKGQLNLGQLMKQRHGNKAMLVGFLTHSGTVQAAPAWGQRNLEFTLTPAIANSDADLFHRTGLDSFLLLLRGNPKLAASLSMPMLQRAVGVVYAPHAELQSHYGPAQLSAQFDAVVYIGRTRALRPL